MDGLILIELALVFTSALLALTLTLASRLVDRPRQARSWALAFGCATLQWAISGFGVVLFGPWRGFGIIAGMFVCAMTTLVTIGARQRVGLPDRYGRFGMAAAAGCAAVLIAAMRAAGDGPLLVVTNLFATLMLPLAVIATARGRRRLASPEICLVVALMLFATFALTLALVALWLDGPAHDEAWAAYRMLLGVGLSPVCLALGLATCFVLAGDLATQLQVLVTRDPLTGALNRRGLEQAAGPVVAAARRHERNLTAVIADIDRFKAINDARGHAAGDRALQRFASTALDTIREDDLVARLGGDEFCLLLTEAAPGSAMLVTERIRAKLGESVTASFGVATMREGEALNALLARADAALYRAKEDGRNRVIVAGQ